MGMNTRKINIRKAAIRDYSGVSMLMDELHQMHVEARPDIFGNGLDSGLRERTDLL